MKTNFLETSTKLEIEVGDVLVFHNGKSYLIVKVEDFHFPFILIDLDTTEEANSSAKLSVIEKNFKNQIKRIIKHKNLEIREVE